MEDRTLDEVRGRILASLREIEAAGSVAGRHGRRMDWGYRNHRVALGLVALLENIARGLGETRVRPFARDDTPGGTPLVLQPTNQKAARLEVFVDWLDDVVQLYPGERARVEMWPGRRQTSESFLAEVARYIEAVVEGSFRATYSSKRPFDAKLEFLFDGKWRRAGGLMIRGVHSAGAITKRFEPY